ncbi:MAG: hypothetical protein C5B58_04880 [Acidobacteria bacterium]|nr:MAG: hypothetical protein C5B58_04880 [Acidobacteriota bacterium]
MSLDSEKRIKLAKGFYLNLSKPGVSLSLENHRAPMTIGTINMDKLAQSQREQHLAAKMGEIIVNSNDFNNLNSLSFMMKRDAFVVAMLKRFGPDYQHDIVRKVAVEEFDMGVEILKLKESN